MLRRLSIRASLALDAVRCRAIFVGVYLRELLAFQDHAFALRMAKLAARPRVFYRPAGSGIEPSTPWPRR